MPFRAVVVQLVFACGLPRGIQQLTQRCSRPESFVRIMVAEVSDQRMVELPHSLIALSVSFAGTKPRSNSISTHLNTFQ